MTQGHLRSVPEPPSAIRADCPKPLEEVILRLLCKDPADRYRSANEVILALNEHLGTDLTDEKGKYDGKIGEKTLAAIARAVREGKIQAVNDSMVDRRLKYLRKLKNYDFNKNGWITRAEKFRIKKLPQ